MNAHVGRRNWCSTNFRRSFFRLGTQGLDLGANASRSASSVSICALVSACNTSSRRVVPPDRRAAAGPEVRAPGAPGSQTPGHIANSCCASRLFLASRWRVSRFWALVPAPVFLGVLPESGDGFTDALARRVSYGVHLRRQVYRPAPPAMFWVSRSRWLAVDNSHAWDVSEGEPDTKEAPSVFGSRINSVEFKQQPELCLELFAPAPLGTLLIGNQGAEQAAENRDKLDRHIDRL